MNIPSLHANPTESHYHEWNSTIFVLNKTLKFENY